MFVLVSQNSFNTEHRTQASGIYSKLFASSVTPHCSSQVTAPHPANGQQGQTE